MDTDETTTDETTDAGDSGPIKQLRAANKKVTEERDAMRVLLMKQAYVEVGLDPEEGLGKAIAKEYDGDPTTEALATYAQSEYGHTKPLGQEHEAAGEIAGQQARLDEASLTAGSVALPSEADALAAAEQGGDWQKTMAIKGDQIAAMFRPS